MSASTRILQLARRFGSVTRQDVVAQRIHTQHLSRLVRAGELERVAPGHYRLPTAPVTEHHTLAVVAAVAPKCTMSSSASSLRGAPRLPTKLSMLNERLRKRLKKDRPNTTITMRIPVDVVESLKAVAPTRGFSGYQTLLKSYISEGLRRDEAAYDQHRARRLAEALKRRGVAEDVLRDALAEVAHSGR